MNDELFAKDLERVGALAQGFYKYREQIAKLAPIVAGTRQRVSVDPEVMAAAWVGFSMARIWPETPRVEESDMPLPEAAELADLEPEQQQFVAFAYGVLGGMAAERPISSLAELAVALAPLVVIPAAAISADGLVDNGYLLQVGAALDLSLEEIHQLLTDLGMAG